MRKIQITLTAAAAIYIAGLLSWQHLHGGVVSHHILHRSDMPAISNWWGALILPLLTWVLAGRISRHEGGPEFRTSMFRLLGGLFYGAILSAAYISVQLRTG